MRISILGTGAYGLALCKMFSKNNCEITLWTKIKQEYDMINLDRCNKNALPEYRVSKDIKITMNIEDAIKESDIIVLAIPIKFIEDTVREVAKYYNKKQCICIACKGIVQDSNNFAYDIVNKYIKTNKVVVISGGTFAVDMANDNPMGITVASLNFKSKKMVKEALSSDLLRVDTTLDVIGVEMFGAIKNVMAIACGMIDGMGYSESTKSMFMTKTLCDINKMICYFDGCEDTIMTYAGIGDFLLTCNSLNSRNYTLGLMYGRGEKKDEIDKYINNSTIEGLYTLKSIYSLFKEKDYKMKIIDILYDILYNDGDIKSIDIFLRNCDDKDENCPLINLFR